MPSLTCTGLPPVRPPPMVTTLPSGGRCRHRTPWPGRLRPASGSRLAVRLTGWLNWRARTRRRTGPLTSGGRAGRTPPDRLAGLLDETERRRWAAYRRDGGPRAFPGRVRAGEDGARAATPASARRTCASTGPAASAASRTASRSSRAAASSIRSRTRATWSRWRWRGAPGRRGRRAARRAPAPAGRGRRSGCARPPRAVRSRAGGAGRGPPAGRARAFLVAWTRKEAVTKATGDGLRAAFSDVVVAADAGPAPPGVLAVPAVAARACPCSTWTRPPGTWRRSPSSAAARRCGPGTARRCSRTGPEPRKGRMYLGGAVPRRAGAL